jgi:uncharacterized protein (DUF934 family)
MKVQTPDDYSPRARTLQMSNDVDPQSVDLSDIERIELHFPKFTDGRAYSQAYLLRRRRNFQGELVATGDVLADQLALIQRAGFDLAVLRAGQCPDLARRVWALYPGSVAGAYQGDARTGSPHFARRAS